MLECCNEVSQSLGIFSNYAEIVVRSTSCKKSKVGTLSAQHLRNSWNTQ